MFESGEGPFSLSSHAEAMERVDNGERLALAMEQEMMAAVELPAYVPPPLDDEAANRMSSKLLDAQGNIISAAHEVPLEGEAGLHRQLRSALKQLDEIAAVLAERFG